MRAALVAAAAALTLAACGGDAEEPTGLSTSDSTPSPEATKTSSEDADTAELKDLYKRYWDAYGKAASGPNLDPALFKGVTTRGFMELKLAAIDRELRTNDLRLIGDAKLSNVTVTIDGDSARVEACLDKSRWRLLEGKKTIQSDFGKPEPDVMSAKRSADGWLFGANVPTKEATITC